MKTRTHLAIVAGTALALSQAALAQTFPQAFDDIATLGAQDWFTVNHSEPIGVIGYFQGNTGVFTPQASPGYLGVNFNSGAGTATLNTWFGTPALNLANGQHFTFWTRTVTGNIYPDRLQVRMSTNGFSTSVGASSTDVGDFTNLLLDINPTLVVAPNAGAFPETWTQFDITISGLGAPTVGRLAFRYFVTSGGPAGANSNYIGIDEATYNGTIAVPPTGACCREDGTCALLSATACTGNFGIYRGDNAPCATANCPPAFGYTGDDATVSNEVGDTIATAALINGTGQQLKYIHGYVALGDRADIYKFTICDRATFAATTVGNGNSLDTELALFDSTGKGLTFDDDTGVGTVQASAQSLITGAFVPANGAYYLAVSTFNNTLAAPILAQDSTGAAIWTEPSPANGTTGGPGWPEWAPNGPSTSKILATNSAIAWNIDPDVLGSYTVALTGACFLGGSSCYANCDGSTSNPLLTANDFQCFLNKYASGDSYANCDLSTSNPLLTANDFQCFLNSYAGGCS